MDRGAWQATVRGVTKSQTGLSTHTILLNTIEVMVEGKHQTNSSCHVPQRPGSRRALARSPSPSQLSPPRRQQRPVPFSLHPRPRAKKSVR